MSVNLGPSVLRCHPQISVSEGVYYRNSGSGDNEFAQVLGIKCEGQQSVANPPT